MSMSAMHLRQTALKPDRQVFFHYDRAEYTNHDLGPSFTRLKTSHRRPGR